MNMKSLKVKTKVFGQPKEIMSKFTQDLLLDLTPPFMDIEITQFDGNKKDDEIHIVASILGSYQSWVNIIKEAKETEDEVYFVDEAKEMPSPFTYWRHTHKVKRLNDTHSEIIDEVIFDTQNSILDLIMYPIVYSLMYYRKPIYMDKFNEPT